MSGFVYFISPVNGGPIRIGHSHETAERVRNLQVYSPVPLEIIATIPGDPFLEAWLHDHFREDRLHGEWLRPSARLFEIIEEAQRGIRHPLLPQSNLANAEVAGRAPVLKLIRDEILKLSNDEMAAGIGFHRAFLSNTPSYAVLAAVMRLVNERGLRFTIEDLNQLLMQKGAEAQLAERADAAKRAVVTQAINDAIRRTVVQFPGPGAA